jgi:mono/diheme cytochrome c family protein
MSLSTLHVVHPPIWRVALVACVMSAGALGAAAQSSHTSHPRSHAKRSRKDSLAVNNVTYQGWKMFEVYCTRCHGEDAVGTTFAPALVHSVGPDGSIDHKTFWLTVTAGRPGKGMPTWGNLLTPEQKEDIWNYLRARAVGGLQRGRPHLKPGAAKDSTAFPPAQGKDTLFVPKIS